MNDEEIDNIAKFLTSTIFRNINQQIMNDGYDDYDNDYDDEDEDDDEDDDDDKSKKVKKK